MSRTVKIAITGPESTGKSFMTEQLAKHFKAPLVSEYARDYLNMINRKYQKCDLKIIAERQIEIEKKILANLPEILFTDTELTVIKIWSEYKYNECPPWLLEKWKSQHYDLYLLMNVDFPWQNDPLREHLNARNELFSLYKEALQHKGANFSIINGLGSERFGNALKAVSEFLKNNIQ